MSARGAHIEQAKANEKLAAHLELAPQFCDWRCTAIHYAALHYIQAYFSGLTPPVAFSTHFLRDTAIREDGKIKRIYNDYRSLKDWSRKTRYELGKPSVSDFSTDIGPSLIAIKRHLKVFVPEIDM